MFFPIILTRILLIASLVFVVGYVFGNFSQRPVLKAITKMATIMLLVLFFAANIFLFRFNGGWKHGARHQGWNCYYQPDSTIHK